MKPPRSKRAGPAARARGDSARRLSSRASLFGSARTGLVRAAAVGACTSPGRGARDRQPRSAEGPCAGSSSIWLPSGAWRRTNSAGGNADRAAEEGTRAAPASTSGGCASRPPQVSPVFTALSGRRGTAGGGSGEVARGASGRRAKLGACSTRLETRTKESNGPASQGATETPRRNEGEGRLGRPRWDPPPFTGEAHHRPAISAPFGVAEAERAR